MRLGSFELESPIGHGGVGVVWSGKHVGTGEAVALKLLSARWAENDEVKAAFRGEVRAVAALDHPNIVRVVDFAEVTPAEAQRHDLAAGIPYLVMELVYGGTLTESAGTLGWEKLESLILDLLNALAHAHAHGITHRDIKGGNILLAEHGAVLTDFGIAHIAARGRNARRTVGAVSSGTPSYMAPEQFRGDWRLFGPSTDLYALGAVIWWLATGHRVFRTKSWAEAARAHVSMTPPAFHPVIEVPDRLEPWLRRCLAKKPADRFGLAADAKHWLLGAQKSRAPWRRESSMPRSRTGAGLGLFGLRTLPVVGRETTRDTLWEALQEVNEDQTPRAVVLRGEPGSGKSKLAEWLCTRAHELGLATPLRAVHGEAAGPIDGIAPMVERHLRLSGVEFDRAGLVEEELRALGATEAWEWEVLARVLDPGDTPPSSTDRNAALRRFFSHLGLERPAIVWLDDAQWAPESLRFCSQVLASPTAVPVLFVLTVRGDALPRRPVESALLEAIEKEQRSLNVAPFASGDLTAFVAEMLDASPDLIRTLTNSSDGNPLFAVQLLEDWVERDMLRPGPIGFTLDAAAGAIPTSLPALWSERIANVLRGFPGQRRALEIGALLGHEIDTAEWCRALDAAGLPDARTLIETLIHRRLARPHVDGVEIGWAFVHGLLRESVLRGLSNPAPLHRACAAAIVGFTPEDLTRRGIHLQDGGEHVQAIEVLASAMTAAKTRNRWDLAEALVARRERSMWASGADRTDPRFGDGWVLLIDIDIVRGRRDQAEKRAIELLEHAVEHRWHAHEARAANLLGKRLVMLWDPKGAAVWFRRAQKRIGSMDEPTVLADSLRGLAMCGLYSSDSEATLEAADAAFEVYKTLGDGAGMGAILHVRAAALIYERRWEDAEADLVAAEPFYDGARLGRCALLSTRANVALRTGNLDKAADLYAQSVEIAVQLQCDIELPIRLGMANLDLHRGEHEKGLAAMLTLRGQIAALGSPGRTARVDAFLAVAQARNGHWDAFDGCLDRFESVEGARPNGDTAEALNDAGNVAAAAAEGERARRAWNLAIDQWVGLGATRLVELTRRRCRAL